MTTAEILAMLAMTLVLPTLGWVTVRKSTSDALFYAFVIAGCIAWASTKPVNAAIACAVSFGIGMAIGQWHEQAKAAAEAYRAFVSKHWPLRVAEAAFLAAPWVVIIMTWRW
jgi:MFS superfamily sulfate permease-like transporter